jgi:hypothetical protein
MFFVRHIEEEKTNYGSMKGIKCETCVVVVRKTGRISYKERDFSVRLMTFVRMLRKSSKVSKE